MILSNISRAEQILSALCARGVKEFVLCAGARNAPFVEVLAKAKNLQVYSFFEERSAGFFALGRIQATGRPVAVVTTSGTAVAELLPAIIESDYSGLPFIALTADRPQSYRGTGAPQTIEQPGIYSHYVETTWDLNEDKNLDLNEWSGLRPCHINVCFKEPLLDQKVSSKEFEILEPRSLPLNYSTSHVKEAWNFFKLQSQKPIVLVGGLPISTAEKVLPFLKRCGLPLYLESHSQLRGHPELRDLEIASGEATLSELKFDGVVRIGSVCTVKAWRELESSKIPVMHFSHLPFAGLTRGEVFPLPALNELFVENLAEFNWQPWQELDREKTCELQVKLQLFNRSEPGLLLGLSQLISENANVFLGNSLPIREWDLAAIRTKKFNIFANRGVNGIDGLISTFIGLADPERENWAILGDLSTLYDLAGPWAAQARGIKNLNLVVVNNGGGKIFQRLFNNQLFENPHQLEFRGFAEIWNWDYQKVRAIDEIKPSSGRPRVIEVVPDMDQTDEFYQ